MKEIWKDRQTPDQVNKLCQSTIHDALGITIDAIGDDSITGSMPVDERTIQPFRIMHGGASAVLAESLASIASIMAAGLGMAPLGLSMTVNHLKPGREGQRITGVAKARQLGRSHFVWEIDLHDSDGVAISFAVVTVVVKPIRPA